MVLTLIFVRIFVCVLFLYFELFYNGVFAFSLCGCWWASILCLFLFLWLFIFFFLNSEVKFVYILCLLWCCFVCFFLVPNLWRVGFCSFCFFFFLFKFAVHLNFLWSVFLIYSCNVIWFSFLHFSDFFFDVGRFLHS